MSPPTNIKYAGAVQLVSTLSQRWGDDPEMLACVHRCMRDFAGDRQTLDIVQTPNGGYSFFERESQPEPNKQDAFVVLTGELSPGVWISRGNSQPFAKITDIQQLIDRSGSVVALAVNGKRFIREEMAPVTWFIDFLEMSRVVEKDKPSVFSYESIRSAVKRIFGV